MATCKECIHSECCFMQYGKTNALKWQSELGCKNFKDRSRFVELPCKVGAKIYDPVRGQISEYIVISFGVNEYGLYLNLRCIQGLCRHDMVRPEWIGTIVFFTLEEAERALKGAWR